jgi:cbb3-type cytochrome oxidase maturation protein
LLVASGFLVAFIWAVKSGQYKDTYTPSVRIILEEDQKTNVEK